MAAKKEKAQRISVRSISSESVILILGKGGKMRHRRSRRTYSRRIQDAERSALEQAYLNSVRQQQLHQQAARQAYFSSIQKQRPFVMQPGLLKKQERPAPIGCYIPLLILVLLIGLVLCSSSHTATNSVGSPSPIESGPSIDATESYCSTGRCSPTAPTGNGYIIECKDGTYSHSGGRRGACSYHGGETRP